ncbi:hypothetical protein WJU16_22780 [Chitinophaga pollutisoli]|uniref:Uncharacterized protein n=1 Tax=Chitinophaga pollutisoli TaxID=3133966 RepID=A0ABZ2YNN0_9BACT
MCYGKPFFPGFLHDKRFMPDSVLFSFRRPRQAAIVLGLIFLVAAAVNIVVLAARPDAFLALSAVAVYDWYVRVIGSSFRVHEQAIVISITLAQLLITLGLFSSGNWRTGALLCALIFFWAIAPFGAGAAFPAPIILSGACLVILFKTNRKQFEKKTHGI